jgi:hypothetical protein
MMLMSAISVPLGELPDDGSDHWLLGALSL